MKIETKFDINNLVVSKYQRNPFNNSKSDVLCCFEVMDINTVTCIAGTQVFYVCRAIHGIKNTDFLEGKRVTNFVDYAIGSNSKGEYMQMREDEIIEAPKDVIDALLNNQS